LQKLRSQGSQSLLRELPDQEALLGTRLQMRLDLERLE
jgi:hypothetical protein